MPDHSVKILTAEQINRAQWDELSHTARLSTWFQSPDCHDLYASAAGMEAFAFGAQAHDRLAAVAVGYVTPDSGLMRHLSRRAIIQGGMLIADCCPQSAVTQLLVHLRRQLSDTIYIELRNFNDYSAYRTAFEAAGFDYRPHYDIHVSTKSDDDILSALSESKRRQYRKALGNGVNCSASTDENDLREFYALLRHHYMTHVRRPLMGYGFFKKIVTDGYGTFLCVKSADKKVIGGMICVGKRYLFEWYISGSDTGQHLYPSVVATTTALLLAKERGYERFDFMGAGEPGVEYGVRDFKMKFGGQLLELGRYIHINKPLRYRLGAWIINAFTA